MELSRLVMAAKPPSCLRKPSFVAALFLSTVLCDLNAVLWKLLQFLIFAAVVMSNAVWQWTPNGLLAGLIGVGAAFIVTLVIVKLGDLARGLTNMVLKVWTVATPPSPQVPSLPVPFATPALQP
jgi:hypothetical protein